jgi:hypothetical protein
VVSAGDGQPREDALAGVDAVWASGLDVEDEDALFTALINNLWQVLGVQYQFHEQ